VPHHNSQKTEKERAKVGLSLDRRLSAYCIAAGCAGVGAAALAQTGSTHAIQYFPASIELLSLERSFQLFPIDIDRNGVTDFNFTLGGSAYSSRSGQNATYSGAVGWSRLPAGAGALNRMLSKGQEIGPSETFGSHEVLLESRWREHRGQTSANCSGLYAGSSKPYIGIKFVMHGDTHYGWIRLGGMQCAGHGSVQGYVTGYAYNTVANAPIQAGQIRSGETTSDMRGSLGMLSLGSAGRK
jgi:hypothetical protein